MKSVNIVTASELLGICRQRIQQLIYANRVKGAYKTDKGWQIPLYKQMPEIIPAKRGMKGTWRTKHPKRPKNIYVNRQTIAANRDEKKVVKDPVIAVRLSSKEVYYGHEVSFCGKCTLIYRPGNPHRESGATVWLEVSPTTQIRVTNWNKDIGKQIMILR